MAASQVNAMEKVREELICAVCLDFLREPKVLLCAHSFCLECLQRITTTQNSYRYSVSELDTDELECPSCRHVTKLPEGKAQNLRTNYNLKRLVDIVSEESKRRTRNSLKVWRSRVASIDRLRHPPCGSHGKPLEYYCLDCSQLICGRCLVAVHKEHDFHAVEAILPKEIDALRNLIQPACEVASRAETAMEQLTHERDVISTNGEANSSAIKLLFSKMRDALNTREKALLNTVQKYTDVKLTKLDAHHQRLEEDREAILQSVDRIQNLIQQTEDTSVLTERQSITEELDLHQQSVLGMEESLEECSAQSARFLTFKEDHTVLRAISELGSLDECRREPNTMFLTVRHVVVTEEEDPYLDVPLRFEDVAAPPQKSVRIDETHVEVSSATDSLIEESCYDYPRPCLPQSRIELPISPKQQLKQPSTNSVTPVSPKSLPKPPPPLPHKIPSLPPSPGPHRPRFPQTAPKRPPKLPPRHPSDPTPGPPKIPPRSPIHPSHSSLSHEIYNVPKSLLNEIGGTYDTPRRTMDIYDVPRSKPHANLMNQRSLSDNHISGASSDDDDYDPIPDLFPVPKPRTKPPPLPPNHPSKQDKPVSNPQDKPVPKPRPRRAVSVSDAPSEKRVISRKRSKTLPLSASLPITLEEDEILDPVQVVGKEDLSLPFSHETVFPCGVCCTGLDDKLLVTDVFNHCLRLVDSSGKFIEKIGRQGRGGGQFTEPSAVIVTPDEHILVAERDNPRVQKFNASRKYVLKFGQKLLWGSQLSDPLGLAVGPNGNVYVSDWDKSAVFVFSSSGKLLSTISRDELKFPAGLAFDSSGRLLVVDRKSHCVHILTSDGEYIGQFGSEGAEHGQLYFPFGIAVSPSTGNVVVTESGNNRVSIFSATGKFLECFGRQGSDPGMFNHPRHVCINSKGQIIVADEMNQRLQVFELDT